MSTKIIEELQEVVKDESRSTESRKQAAELILTLKAKTVEPAPAEDGSALKGIFDAMLNNSDAKERQQEEDRAMKVCSNCYRLQDQENLACELCDASPEWRVPSAVRRNDELAKFLSLAESATVDDLSIALRSAWCCNNESQRVTRLLLGLREVQKSEKLVKEVVEESVVDNVQPIDMAKINAYLDMKIAEVQRQIDAAKGQA